MPKIIGQTLAEHRQRTRAALFEALSVLLSQRPFEKITLSDVASRAGVGRTAVYNHFSDKEDLLLAFMEHETQQHAAELARALTVTDDPIDRLRLYVRHQALVKRSYHFPTTGPLSSSVSRPTASRLRAHAGLMMQMLSQILTDAMDQGLIPRQEPREVIPLIHATVMGGRPTPTTPDERDAFLAALDSYVLRAVGSAPADHAVPQIPPLSSTEPVQPRATAPRQHATA